MLYVIEDNGYAISTPVEANTPGGNISRLIANFPNFHFAEVDGTDAIASYAAMVEAVAYCRAGKGPAVVHGHVVRPYSHSQSDDESNYRSAGGDPGGGAAGSDLADADVAAARGDSGCGGDQPAGAVGGRRGAAGDGPGAGGGAGAAGVDSEACVFGGAEADRLQCSRRRPQPTADAAEHTMLDLINHCLQDEMRRDERIVVFGEDVADATRDAALMEGKLKGKGGVFKVTHGLQKEFGSDRVWNSPLAEANITGRAIGMAVRGMKPVVEIQFFDYIWPAMHQMRNELALMRWRSNGQFSCPVVMRVPAGGYLTGGSIYHSQSGESIFTHTPGVRIVMPSNALDAIGLLRTAIRCDDPVLFLEHKNLYRSVFGRAAYPGPEYMIPFGKAAVVKPGKDLTVITYGAVVPRALEAARRMERELGVSVELIDLRSLSPYDWEAIATSVKKTSKVIVAHEDMKSWGYGAEIAARIGDELFDDLDAPVRRVGAMDTFVGYQPLLENEILPQVEHLFAAMKELAAY